MASDLESNTQQSTHLHPYNYYILLNSNKSSCAISASNKNLSQTFQSSSLNLEDHPRTVRWMRLNWSWSLFDSALRSTPGSDIENRRKMQINLVSSSSCMTRSYAVSLELKVSQEEMISCYSCCKFNGEGAARQLCVTF